jgi:hypothetical protein
LYLRLYRKRDDETTFMNLQHSQKLRALRISGPGYGRKPLLDDRIISGNSDALKHVYLSSIQFERSTFFGPNLHSLYLGSCSFPSRNDLETNLPTLAYLGFSSNTLEDNLDVELRGITCPTSTKVFQSLETGRVDSKNEAEAEFFRHFPTVLSTPAPPNMI